VRRDEPEGMVVTSAEAWFDYGHLRLVEALASFQGTRPSGATPHTLCGAGCRRGCRSAARRTNNERRGEMMPNQTTAPQDDPGQPSAIPAWAPKLIYLQVPGEGSDPRPRETTWCEDKINEADIAYVQAADVWRLIQTARGDHNADALRSLAQAFAGAFAGDDDA
jgi:hypothetical protein